MSDPRPTLTRSTPRPGSGGLDELLIWVVLAAVIGFAGAAALAPSVAGTLGCLLSGLVLAILLLVRWCLWSWVLWSGGRDPALRVGGRVLFRGVASWAIPLALLIGLWWSPWSAVEYSHRVDLDSSQQHYANVGDDAVRIVRADGSTHVASAAVSRLGEASGERVWPRPAKGAQEFACVADSSTTAAPEAFAEGFRRAWEGWSLAAPNYSVRVTLRGGLPDPSKTIAALDAAGQDGSLALDRGGGGFRPGWDARGWFSVDAQARAVVTASILAWDGAGRSSAVNVSWFTELNTEADGWLSRDVLWAAMGEHLGDAVRSDFDRAVGLVGEDLLGR